MAELLYKVKHLEHIKLAVVLIGLNITDLILTQVGLSRGAYEANPMMRYFFEHHLWVVWTLKVGWITAITLIALWLADAAPRLVKVVFIVFIILLAFACIYNGIQIYLTYSSPA